MKHILQTLFLVIMICSSCKKTVVSSSQQLVPASSGRQLVPTSADTSTQTVPMALWFGFKLQQDDWKTYPYIGGEPGFPDSFLCCWSPRIDFPNNYSPKDIAAIYIKDNKGRRFLAREFIIVSPTDSGYLYQPGESLQRPQRLLLWWIQKQPTTRPSADSVFIYLKQ